MRHLEEKKPLPVGIHRTFLLSAALFAISSLGADKPPDLYKANCEGCHGSSGRGSDLGKTLGVKSFKSPAIIKMPPSALAKVIAKGKNQMPPFEDTLSAAEIKDLAKYIKEMK